jgi:hypothetical protein
MFTGQFYGAGFCAFAASGAFGRINKAGGLLDPDLEMAFLSFYIFDFSQCDQFDVDVPADLDQLGRNNSHGTVIGRKGFVQLGHGTADARTFFQQVNIIAGVGQIQR